MGHVSSDGAITIGQFEAVIGSAMDAIIAVDEQEVIVLFNPAAELMFGTPASEALGKAISTLIPPEYRKSHHGHIGLFRSTGVTGRRMGALGAISGLRANGETFRVEAAISQSRISGKWIATVILRDITERLANEEARILLSREVDHRAKNALAVVKSIVTLTTADTTAAYVAAISGRIDSLSRAHGLLAQGNWKGGDLRSIFDKETMGLHGGGKMRLRGPDVTLSASAVQPLSLLVHELTTNAIKHGALSVVLGSVSVDWSILANGDLNLHWVEHGGPATAPPKTMGFGTQFIESLTSQLQGAIVSHWQHNGLLLELTLPASAVRLGGATQQVAALTHPAQVVTGLRNKVLLVEDEALIAMALTSGLKLDGWDVVGTASTVEHAVRILEGDILPDVAVLDINLDGVEVYPVADMLLARGIPFLFYSGYAAPVRELRFRDAPLLGKPISSRTITGEMRLLLADSNIAA